MSLTIPTYQDLVDTAISNYETSLGQDAPLTPKAFLRILARVQALHITGLYKLAAERTLQNLVLTATDEDLERIGEEYGVPRQDAVPAELVLTCTGTNGVDIPAGTVFIGDANGLLYYTQALVTIASGTASPTVTCYTAGVDSELLVSDTLTLSSPITGINNSATVASISVNGLDQEDLEVYRRQVQDEIQTTGGGSNLADFRNWAQETPSIVRAFPYSGAPIRQSIEYIDLDMEEVGVAEWTAEGGATLTKGTSVPAEGTQYLRITRVSSNPGAYQDILRAYHKYNVTGYARGDGTANPVLYVGTNVIWTGTSSTSWQAFDVNFEADTATYQTRLRLFSINGGGGNYSDFDGIELTDIDVPGLVTVYAECDSSYEADGIPDQTLLDDVRDYIITDQVTGIDRPSLGLIDDNLFVEPIIRTGFYLEIRGLSIASELETQAKADLTTEVDAYLKNATPYIQGLDSQSSQADEITDPLLSNVVQSVLTAYGATCTGVGIGITPGVFISSYSLGAGELAKLATSGITYV